uniref:Uncharacterized protein n=1 Tax=Solanum lycopersicum TaxID=4081 RepID=A0A3Q7H6P8_SOLLC
MSRSSKIRPTAHASERHMREVLSFGAKITLLPPNLAHDHVPAMCICPALPNLPLGFNLLNGYSCVALSLQLV